MRSIVTVKEVLDGLMPSSLNKFWIDECKKNTRLARYAFQLYLCKLEHITHPEEKTRKKIMRAIGKMETQFQFLYRHLDFNISLCWANINYFTNKIVHEEYLVVWQKGIKSNAGKRGITVILRIHRDLKDFIYQTLLFDGTEHFEDFGTNPVIESLQYNETVSIITPSQPRVILDRLDKNKSTNPNIIEWGAGTFLKLLPKEIKQ